MLVSSVRTGLIAGLATTALVLFTVGYAIEGWLAIQLSDAPDISNVLACLEGETPSQRVLALYRVLGRRPDLAWRTGRLSVQDQLQLSLDLVRAGRQVQPHTRTVAPVLTAARCRASRCSRRRAW